MLTAGEIADLFVAVSKTSEARVSYRGGVQRGNGAIPYDTGATQQTIYKAREQGNQAVVGIGNEAVYYVKYLQYADTTGGGQPNRHKEFVQKAIVELLVPAIEQKYRCKVEIK